MSRARARAIRAAALGSAALALLVPASSARAAPAFGVAEDAMKYATDGGASLFARMRELGMTENRVSVYWNPNDPTAIQEQGFLDRMLPVARRSGIKIIFSVRPAQALAFAADPRTRVALFAGYLKTLVQTYPDVTEIIVGNEPNEKLFLQPQHDPNGEIASAGLYEAMLAAGYDALKSVNPDITVIGLAVSPDGNDMPGANNESVSPARFIKAVGDAYRRSRRAAPLMDLVDLHIYARVNTDPLTKSRQWPNAGAADLDRIKQAVWDAFHGTAQPVFPEGPSALRAAAAPGVVRYRLAEIATQAGIDPALVEPSLYSDQENVPTVSEATQAQFYADVVNLLKCDSTVASMLFFHLIDEQSLKGFQSGLLRRNFTTRPAFSALGSSIAGAGTCSAPHLWTHSTGVLGAAATFDTAGKPAVQRIFGLTATAEEDAFGRAAIFAVDGAAPNTEAVARALAVARPLTPVLRAEKLVKAYNSPRFEFTGRLRPGRYVYAIRLRAAMNPSRSTTLLSAVFTVGS